MKSILLIGLGRFGRHIAEELNKLGHEVMAVDENEDRVNAVLSIVTNAKSATAPTRNSWRRWASAILMSVLWRSVETFRARLKPLPC